MGVDTMTENKALLLFHQLMALVCLAMGFVMMLLTAEVTNNTLVVFLLAVFCAAAANWHTD